MVLTKKEILRVKNVKDSNIAQDAESASFCSIRTMKNIQKEFV
jgi:hypothetical protein